MNLSVGIVGLPNVGKSTLFNALLKKQQAFVANYPFATIEPNIGIVPVPDNRLDKLAEIVSKEIASPGLAMTDSGQARMTKKPPLVPATVKFVDIAGLVKGAAEGEGLGNKFLSHIREVSIIAHVVRAFDPSTSSGQETIIKVGTNPKEDYQTIETELMLADLQTVQAVQSRIKKFSDPNEKSTVEKLFKALNEGKPARDVQLTDEERKVADQLFLLSAKPEVIVLNIAESEYSKEKIRAVVKQYKEILRLAPLAQDDNFVVICAKIEAELAELSQDEQKEYLKDLGVEKSGLERLIQKAYETLGLISFLTAGEKEVRAWTIEKGTNAQNAAGVIHTDFIKNFIKAEVVSFDDFAKFNGWKKAREVGKTRFEGRDYIVRDGDVIEFKIGK